MNACTVTPNRKKRIKFIHIMTAFMDLENDCTKIEVAAVPAIACGKFNKIPNSHLYTM